MSQYLVLIQTTPTFNTVIDPFSLWTGGYDIDPQDYQRIPVTIYALTTSNHPPTGLSLLQSYCPIKLQIVHTVRSLNQTEFLQRTLRIKFQHRLLHSFWYAFNAEDVNFIKTLSENNFSSMIGFIHRQLKKPDMTPEQLREFVNEQLQKAERAL